MSNGQAKLWRRGRRFQNQPETILHLLSKMEDAFMCMVMFLWHRVNHFSLPIAIWFTRPNGSFFTIEAELNLQGKCQEANTSTKNIALMTNPLDSREALYNHSSLGEWGRGQDGRVGSSQIRHSPVSNILCDSFLRSSLFHCFFLLLQAPPSFSNWALSPPVPGLSPNFCSLNACGYALISPCQTPLLTSVLTPDHRTRLRPLQKCCQPSLSSVASLSLSVPLAVGRGKGDMDWNLTVTEQKMYCWKQGE